MPAKFAEFNFQNLSEKGYEQNSDRDFWAYTEAKMDRKVPFRRPVGLRRRRLRTFSDSFEEEFSEVHIQNPAYHRSSSRPKGCRCAASG
jgi:hypothetical protein